MTQPEWYVTAARVLRRTQERWRSVAVFALVGAGVGGGTAMVLPSRYRAGAAFQAESAQLPPVGGTLAGLASQLGGLQLGAGQSNAQFFGDLLKTDAVLRQVAQGSYPWRGRQATLPEVYGYEGKAPGWREYDTVRRLRKALAVDVNVRTGVVSFGVEARTPELALALTERSLVALNQANIELRQARARAERTFTAGRAESAKRDLTDAEDALAAFYQRNRTFQNAPALLVEESRLRRAVEMAQQVYVQLRLQEEQAAVQEVRNTPAISVVDAPVLPVKRSWPRRRVAVLTGLLAGLALALVRLTLTSS